MEVAPNFSRTSGSLAAAVQKDKSREIAPLEGRKIELSRRTESRKLMTESAWQKTPARKAGTYKEKYLNNYKSQWMMRKNSAAATRQAIQSVMSRHQDYPTFQNHPFPTKQP